MEIIHLSVDTPMQVHDSVCALGFFDGVHLGHQQLLKEVEHIAKEKELKKAIMTFSVHPKQILENNNYHYLMSLSEKINILKQWQFDYFYIIDFDQTVANLKPNTFLQNYIINHQIKHVVCGFDFHFGKKGMGDVHVLQENKSFDVTVIEEYSEDALKVSSSYIKKLLNEGNIEKANHLLTRFYRVSGQVIYGLQNGRKIGFPTANIDNLSLEVNIFDFDQDIYGEDVDVDFVFRVRDEKKFKSLNHLKEQLQKDKKHIDQFLD